MKDWPLLVLGGSSPVHACFRHSMIVWGARVWMNGVVAACKVCSQLRACKAPAARAHRLAGAIGSDDERQRAVKLDHILVVGRKAADALYEKLVGGRRWRGEGAVGGRGACAAAGGFRSGEHCNACAMTPRTPQSMALLHPQAAAAQHPWPCRSQFEAA